MYGPNDDKFNENINETENKPNETTRQPDSAERVNSTENGVPHSQNTVYSTTYTTPAQQSPAPVSAYYSNTGYEQRPYQTSASRSSYTWPQQPAPQSQPQPQPQSQPQPHPVHPYYQPAPMPYMKPRKKSNAGKIFLKAVAVVLCCAVVSIGSVGAFALMIQNGIINISSPESAETTAAFTIHKVEESADNAAVGETIDGKMSAQDVAEKLIPSVVCIQNYQISQQNYFYFGGMFQQEESSSDVSPASQGSGIIISEDGYIVTNQHVIADATSLKVNTSDGSIYEATVVGQDELTDLAVIKIDAQGLSPAEFGSVENLRVADQVIAIGNPGGIQFNSTVTMGNVSALNREVTSSSTGFSMECIQTDAAINPGNSGGALVDLYGHVVGVNSSKIVATGYEGLGFAIPSDTAQPIISDLIEYGYVKDRARLGVSGQYIDSFQARFYGLESGYYVDEVTASNAVAAGLERGDVITAVDDTQIVSANTLSAYIAKKKPGDTVTLTVSRALSGEVLTLEAVLSEYVQEPEITSN